MEERLLLIDSCGETSGVALSVGAQVIAAEDLVRGNASAEIISVVRKLLGQLGWRLAELDGVGVVSGPGSFTGMRIGLATAKGLCHSARVPLAAVSRLDVLADAAALRDGFVALDAGRGEVYVRDIRNGREWLCSSEDIPALCGSKPVAIAEAGLAERLADCRSVLCLLHVSDALPVMLRRLHAGGNDVSLSDANYVREESDIYRKQKKTASTV